MNRSGGHVAKSIIVSAHPDDEVLWFSSIIEDVDEIVICFLDVESQPEWTAGRRESIPAYPLPQMSSLGVTESEVFDGADWNNPVAMSYGLDIVRKTGSVSRYKDNYFTLRALLSQRLEGYTNVYTHNPWGEYGHEEHVQVYRAVKSLQSTMHFNLWYTGYFSNKSALLMNRSLSRSGMANIRRPVNRAIASRIKDLYVRNKCWTWYENYTWPEHECFIHDESPRQQNDTFGMTIGLNYIKIWQPHHKSQHPLSVLRRAMRSLSGSSR